MRTLVLVALIASGIGSGAIGSGAIGGGAASSDAAIGGGPAGGLLFPPPTALLIYDADDIAVVGDGNPVTSWTSTGSSAIVLSQGNATRQPTYEVTGLNGHAEILLDGGDWLETATDLADLAQPHSVCTVARWTDAAGNEVLVDSDATSPRGMYLGGFSDTFRMFAGAFVASAANARIAGANNCICATYNGASSFFTHNGTQVSGDPGAGSNDPLTIGCDVTGAACMTGAFSQVYAWDRALTAADHAQYCDYASQRFGVTW